MPKSRLRLVILVLSCSAAMEGQSLTGRRLTDADFSASASGLNVAWAGARRMHSGLPAFDVSGLKFTAVSSVALPEAPAGGSETYPSDKGNPTPGGYALRILHDQKSLYAAPFKPANLKWDALVLIPTGILIAEDRHIERQLPTGNLGKYSTISNIVIGSTAGGLAATWLYGLKSGDSHAAELGYMEIESLIDTLFVYAPMQFTLGRQRPGEGNGNGDFWRHHSLNTSFPAGHAMFTWNMASVAAHEYPKTWVKLLAYGAALTVTTSRFVGRDHWAGDTFAGAALGYFIGSHVFHTRCDPELDKGCTRPKE